MELKEILAKCDHTILKQTATWEDVKKVVDEGIKYGTASVCIPPCFVGQAKAYSGRRVPVCTVIGFPNGYNSTEAKVYEAERAVADGADEIDMVINIGTLKSGALADVTSEIKAVKKACGDKVLKVIVETCLLTEEEKKAACKAVTDAGADYIKTSTGFSTGGATFADVKLFKENVGEGIKIKAAGGISSVEDAEKFIALGADRLGTSRIVKIAVEREKNKEGI